MKKVCILGQGYTGLPTALMFAAHGLKVVGVDVNQEIIHTLSNGGLHIEEPGLKEYFDQALAGGNLTFSTVHSPSFSSWIRYNHFDLTGGVM